MNWPVHKAKDTMEKAEQDVEELLGSKQGYEIEVYLQKLPWCQRRVLELLLFGQIIFVMRTSADEILNQARSVIRIKSQNPVSDTEDPDIDTQDDLEELDKLDYNGFLATRDQFEPFQKVLQTLQADLNENLAKIDQWRDREKERQSENPRWTFNDESRYRSDISKLEFSNNREVQELRRSHAMIVNLSGTIARKLDNMRNDVESQRADDIQRFTWVTIVFLPIGFATGLFSMSGAPPGQIVWHMVVTAVGALVITVLLLVLLTRTKRIRRRYDQASKRVFDFLRSVFKFMRSTPESGKAKGKRPTTRQDDVENTDGSTKSNGSNADLERGGGSKY
ncbi:hypothetical protein ACHAPJ_008753 [Fusarium lateritium]